MLRQGAELSGKLQPGGADASDASADQATVAEVAGSNEADQIDSDSSTAEGQEGSTAMSSTATYSTCMEGCSTNFTTTAAFSCDGGEGLREAAQEYEALLQSFLLAGNGELTFQAEKALKEWKATLPPSWEAAIDQVLAGSTLDEATNGGAVGELCYPVDRGCVFNETRKCGGTCDELVDFYRQLCFAEEERNASYAYNITSCRLPDPYFGALIGQPKYIWYLANDQGTLDGILTEPSTPTGRILASPAEPTVSPRPHASLLACPRQPPEPRLLGKLLQRQL